MDFSEALNPPGKDLFHLLEESYRIQLPSAFKEFFLTANGGVPKHETVVGEQERLIERFLTILDDPSEHPAGMYDIHVVITQIDDRLVDDEDMVGMNLIPFAVLFAGDFLCLDYRGAGEPSVVIWDHERSEELKPYTEPLATSFEEFLTLLP